MNHHQKIEIVTNPAAKAFLNQFFGDRAINRVYYEKVPDDKFDYRMVDTKDRKSDSPQESLAHQIGIQRDYLYAIETGKLEFKSGDNKTLKALPKSKLLKLFQEEDERMIQILSDENNCKKPVIVYWSKEPIPTVSMLWSLDSHEILHTGWNLAVMDHLNIERFPALKKMWG